MDTVAVALPPDLKARLEALAAQTGQSLPECLVLAVSEYVTAWEIHLNDVHQINEREVRAVLNVADPVS